MSGIWSLELSCFLPEKHTTCSCGNYAYQLLNYTRLLFDDVVKFLRFVFNPLYTQLLCATMKIPATDKSSSEIERNDLENFDLTDLT